MKGDLFELVGATIADRYRVDAVVGEGGFGVVYRGWHVALERSVAVKCLKVPEHFNAEAQQTFLERFQDEGKLLAKLGEHGSIVRVFDFGLLDRSRGQTPYLVLEWLEGRDLRQLLDERHAAGQTFGEHEAIDLLRPVIDALAFAHRQGVVHRDIKPANLFVAETAMGRRIKVLDFGIGKALQEGERVSQLVSKTQTAFRAFSPDYGAPEQCAPKRFGASGPHTDVHALGLVLTELVTGRPPYDADEMAELFLAAIMQPRPTPRVRGAVVSEPFEAICARALALNPAERFRDAKELLAAIDALESPRAAIAATMAEDPARAETALAPAFLPTVAPAQSPMAAAASTLTASASGVPSSGTVVGPAIAPPAPAPAPPPAVIPPVPARASGPRRPTSGVVVGVVGLGVLLAAGVGVWAVIGRSGKPPRERDRAATVARDGQVRSTEAPGLAAPSPGPCADGMVHVAAGVFRMGSTDGDADERPVHEVSLAAFCIDRTETTVSDYQKCASAGTCTPAAAAAEWPGITPADRVLWSPLCNGARADRADHPANCVDWSQAADYCRWAGKRLPSEEEWEYAARGMDGRQYAWGNAPPGPELLNACGRECVEMAVGLGKSWPGLHGGRDDWATTAPVGRFPAGASPFGVLDMTGNVWEWTASGYSPDYAAARASDRRVVRGGGWARDLPAVVRAANRSWYAPTVRISDVGFRCAK